MAWDPVVNLTGPQGIPGPAGAPYSGRYALTYAASLTPNAGNGLYQRCTTTGNPTLNPPTGAQDGMRLWIRFQASGAARTVTIASGISRATGVAATLVVASGKCGDVGLFYDAYDGVGKWTCLAASAQQ